MKSYIQSLNSLALRLSDRVRDIPNVTEGPKPEAPITTSGSGLGSTQSEVKAL